MQTERSKERGLAFAFVIYIKRCVVVVSTVRGLFGSEEKVGGALFAVD